MKKIKFFKPSNFSAENSQKNSCTQSYLNKNFHTLIYIIYFFIIFASVNFEIFSLAKLICLLFFPLFTLIANVIQPNSLNISDFQSPLQTIFLIILCPILLIFTEKANKRPLNAQHSNSKNEDLLIFIHDLKNLMLPALGYAEINNIEKTRNKLYEICKKLNEISNLTAKLPVNILIENIINAKKSIIEHSKIVLNYKICKIKEINIEDEDCCSLIGNIVDNAIEACNKIPELNKRFINLEITKNKNSLIITMENSRLESPDKYPKHKSPNKLLHGYGLKSVTQTAKKYGGHVVYFSDGNLFFTQIIIPNRIIR